VAGREAVDARGDLRRVTQHDPVDGVDFVARIGAEPALEPER
jgi:hypothetical protein